jgi:hypothetical protein
MKNKKDQETTKANLVASHLINILGTFNWKSLETKEMKKINQLSNLIMQI